MRIRLKAVDDKGNVATFVIAERLRSKFFEPPKSVLVVSNRFLPQIEYSILYVTSLTELGARSDVWVIEEGGLPSTELLLNYDYVVWTNARPDLTFGQESGYLVIREHLERGGRFLLTGNRIAWAASNNDQDWLEFVASTSHAAVVSGLAGVKGVFGRESQNLSFDLTGYNEADLMTPFGTSETLFAWEGLDRFAGASGDRIPHVRV